MSGSKNEYIRLTSALADKCVLEHFLSELMGTKILLRRPPTKALPWQSIRIFPDIDAVDQSGVAYQIYIGSCGTRSLIQELQYYARGFDGDGHTSLHIILVQPDAAFKGQQSYCRLGPAIVNTDGPPEDIGSTNVTYHVLSASSKCIRKNAPLEIQLLLDHLSGTWIETPGELLQMIKAMPYQWYWADGLRWDLKATSTLVFMGAIEAGRSEHEALIDCADVESSERASFVRIGINFANTLKENFDSDVSAASIAASIGIPVDMVEAIQGGYTYTEADMRKYYMDQR